MTKKIRMERDSMGEVPVPSDAYWGAQTARALENFPISGIPFPRPAILALAKIKRAAAQVNAELGQIPKDLADVIVQACDDVLAGRMDRQFPVDVFQTGSGTSTNMNMNEVLANRANEILGRPLGTREPVHPNDHVNRSQSSNDVIPSCIHMAVATAIHRDLFPVLAHAEQVLVQRAHAFSDVVRIGRTHLQDAVPMRMGQVFSGYARQVHRVRDRLAHALSDLMELPLGGTAVGTGLNAPSGFASRVIQLLAADTGLPFREAVNHFEAQGSRDGLVAVSGALRGAAVAWMKIANDIRWLGSGPRCGLGELKLAAVQPGSSIMPGKVNPVLAEALCQVCAQVMGYDTAVMVAGQSGNMELNVMMPLMAVNLLESVRLMTAACRVFTEKCLEKLEVDRDRCAWFVEQSLALVTGLVSELGYDRAAALAKEAWETGRTIRDVVTASGLLDRQALDRLLDPDRMAGPMPEEK